VYDPSDAASILAIRTDAVECVDMIRLEHAPRLHRS
jgi:hypothetical protein